VSDRERNLQRDIINPPGLPAENPTYCQAIRANGFVYVAGQIGTVPGTRKLVSDDIAEQAGQALQNTATILEAAGSSLSKVVSSSLFLTEFDQLSRVNAVYSKYFPQEGPAKFACGVTALYGGAKFEIQVIALA
jgi:2-iminobutanoate/2-iminopropanoate deaminase